MGLSNHVRLWDLREKIRTEKKIFPSSFLIRQSSENPGKRYESSETCLWLLMTKGVII